jgi:ABC-type lipoprotein export system ATPase subunit
MTPAPAVTVRGLTRRFRRAAETVVALDDVHLDLFPGELTVAAGPSGSGKTTLLSIVAGFEVPDEGSVVVSTVEGIAPGRLGWRNLAFVPQALALFDELTVAENVDLPARLDPTAGAAGRPLEELLDLLEIEHLAGRYPSETSGGEQQRTAIGRALRLRPPLLLADEPTGHQDRGRVDLVLGILRQHAYAGAAVLISSHDEAVISMADRVVTLDDGRIVADSKVAI